MKKKIKYKNSDSGTGKAGRRIDREKTIKYSEENIGSINIVNDFLPKPEELVLKEPK